MSAEDDVDSVIEPLDHPHAVENMKPGDQEIECRDEYGRQILTVKALREMLEGVPETTHVVIATDAWYRNIHNVIVPGCAECGAEWSAVTLFPGLEIDARQF